MDIEEVNRFGKTNQDFMGWFRLWEFLSSDRVKTGTEELVT